MGNSPAQRSLYGIADVTGEITAKQFPPLLDGPVQQDGFPVLLPYIRAVAITEIGVDILALHNLQGMTGTQVMTFAAATNLFYFLKTQGLGVDFDAAGDPQSGADGIIVQQQALRAGAQ